MVNTILREYLNDEQSNSSSEITNSDKLYIQVVKLVRILMRLPEYQRLSDIQKEVIEILQPGINKRQRINNMIADFYFQYLDDEPNFQHFSDRGCSIQ